MRGIRILSVSGLGKASHAIFLNKLTVALEKDGYDIEITEVNPSGVANAMKARKYDLMVYISPVEGNYDIPILNATGFFVGINENEFIDDFINEINKLTL